MRKHAERFSVKCEQSVVYAIITGLRSVQLNNRSRNFQEGDIVVLNGFNESVGHFTGYIVVIVLTKVMKNDPLLQKGNKWVMVQFEVSSISKPVLN